MRPALLSAVLVVGGFVGSSEAQPSNSLRDLGAIGVAAVTATPSELLDRITLGQAELQTATELRLRQSGITISNDSTWPTLWVHVTLVPVMSGGTARTMGYAYSLEVELHELVTSHRLGHPIEAVTWQLERIAVGSSGRGQIRESLNVMIDEFSNHYLTANPR